MPLRAGMASVRLARDTQRLGRFSIPTWGAYFARPCGAPVRPSAHRSTRPSAEIPVIRLPLAALHAALVASLFAPVAGAQVAPDAVLLRTPDVSRDQICFRYDGDVWLVPKQGGEARRLSSVPGNESFPRFSPDGQSIAFMGGYQGGNDLYVIGIDGGVPRRLTHHPDSELLCDWLPGGEGLLFSSPMTSGQRRASKLFTVATEGGQPIELPVPFGTFGAIDASGRQLAYVPYSYSEF